MKDTTFPEESFRKLLRRGATSHLLNMLHVTTAVDLPGPLAFFGLAGPRLVWG